MIAARLRQALERLKGIFGSSEPTNKLEPANNQPRPPAQVAGCSVGGKKNERNEDAWSARTPTEETLVIAVGDGLGSKTHAHEGSAAATTAAAAELAEAEALTDDGDATSDRLAAPMEAAFAAARTAVEQRASTLGAPVDECATTLLAVASDRSETVAAAVGDGGIVGDDDGVYFPVIDREAGEYANVTTPLTAAGWRDAYRFGYTDRAEAVAVFTDGLSNFTWERAGDATPETAFFEQVFPPVHSARRAAEVEPALCAFLGDEHFRQHSRDDKTLVVGVPVPRPSTPTATVSAGTTDPAPRSTSRSTGETDR
ncbi:MAG: hypothetical protein J07HX5_00375 [halophilic archaeon J07HX5]|nr:MAG: hypothetical protein J07HX5_00375 [halophilic archaeon J07HX5]